jgi:hypothetical protein
MYIADLSPLRYSRGPLDSNTWSVPLRAVGWLAAPHPFPGGVVPSGFLDKFESLVNQTNGHFSQYTFRGAHDCDWCEPAVSIDRSWINVLVPGDGEIFGVTASLLHYVTAHGYRPPSAFVSSAMACPPCTAPEYLEALRVANGGTAAPLETGEQCSLRWKLEGAAILRWREVFKIPIESATREEALGAALSAWPEKARVDEDGNVVLGSGVRVLFDNAGRFLKFSDSE